MLAEDQITADKDAIRRDLSFMMKRWDEIDAPVKIELRAFGEGKQPKWGQFAPNWLEEAVDWCVSMNETGHNVYAVRNPVRGDCTRSARDEDIVGSFFLWADCDDPVSAGNVYRFDGPKWTAAVTTGKTPSTRVHVYWELEHFQGNLPAWRAMQVDIAAHFGSDGTVVNPSRIMRVGGTVSYPAAHKQERGYISEVCTIRTEYDDDRDPVTIEQMQRVFGERTPAAPPKSAPLIDIGPAPLDRERATIQALAGQDWHNAVIRLVASYVSKGLSDAEIHALTDPLTLAGYTVDQTRDEVQKAIDGARAKGFAPTEYAAPEFDAPKTDAPGVRFERFDDIEPLLTDSYLIKGVIGCGAMSVVYGPSNSGKTFFALDLAFHIASGSPWRDLRVKQASVLYLAAEGGRGVQNRVYALRKETGLCDVPLYLRRAGMDLLHSQADLQGVKDLADEVRALNPELPLLIVVDTLSRVMAGGDENSAADMTALIRNVDAIRGATEGHIMLVHHTGKDTARGARGHSSLRAATDTEIEVQNEDGQRAAQVSKQRDYQGGECFAFSLKTVHLGVDQDGDDVTTCVVESADSAEFQAVKKASKGRGKNQQIVMDTFDQMVSEGLAQGNPGGIGMPEPGQFWAVDMDELRRLSQGKMTGNKPSALFRQAWDALTAKNGLFVTGHKLAWRIDRRKS